MFNKPNPIFHLDLFHSSPSENVLTEIYRRLLSLIESPVRMIHDALIKFVQKTYFKRFKRSNTMMKLAHRRGAQLSMSGVQRSQRHLRVFGERTRAFEVRLY